MEDCDSWCPGSNGDYYFAGLRAWPTMGMDSNRWDRNRPGDIDCQHSCPVARSDGQWIAEHGTQPGRDHYDLQINTEEEHRLLHDLLDATNRIEIKWFRLPEGNPLIGQTLAKANLRAQAGASVVAILRQGQLMVNPKSMTVSDVSNVSMGTEKQD